MSQHDAQGDRDVRGASGGNAEGGPRKGRRAYLDDYRLNDDGEYEYGGLMWSWASHEAREAFLRRAAALLAGAVALLAGAGFVPAPGVGNAIYVLLPYGAACVATAMAIACLARVWREGDRLRDHVYQKGLLGLVPRLAIGAVASGLSAAGELVHLLLVSAGAPWLSAAFVALLACAAACLGVLLHLAKGVRILPDA